jgi:hypothetical protein
LRRFFFNREMDGRAPKFQIDVRSVRKLASAFQRVRKTGFRIRRASPIRSPAAKRNRRRKRQAEKNRPIRATMNFVRAWGFGDGANR